ncbi:hypothetical protein [Rodentibacter myodis]|uniref:Uncharacterized protein n=1 Tax=Rodentibacter myodis TaxID=1907939 RepID=A0A1V3JM67_9PAST|nr:hypothetical protein [Rodentibacter myodis]OOF57322.1 hypothetical protein BKL49_09585 [Rodentibacter myodis]
MTIKTSLLRFPNGAELEFFAGDSHLFDKAFAGFDFPKSQKRNTGERRVKQKRKQQKIARRLNRN